MQPITLSTKRLILRRANNKDSEKLFQEYFSDSYSSRFLTRKPHNHIDQTIHFLNNWCNANWENNSDKFAWVIASAGTNHPMGVFLVELDDQHTAQIHFGIGQQYARQGYISEAGIEIIRWLLSQELIKKIWAVCDLSNEGSIKVLDNLGLKREKIIEKYLIFLSIENSPRDCYLYSLKL